MMITCNHDTNSDCVTSLVALLASSLSMSANDTSTHVGVIIGLA